MSPGALGRVALPPLLAFALARSVLGAAALSAGVPPLRPGSWCRFDCSHYVRIAQRGYELAPCPADSPQAGLWCGTTAWLPGYPLLIRAVHAAGVSPRRAGVLVSAVFALLALGLAWAALAGPLAGPGAPPHGRAATALALAALFPGTVYAHAISPLGVFGAAVVASLVLAARGRPAAAGLAGAAAAFTYPPGILLAPVLGAGFLLGSGSLSVRVRHATLGAALAASGFAAVMAMQYLDTGEWQAFALMQRGYHYSPSSPLHSLAARVAPLFRPPFEGADEALPAQTLLLGVLVALGVAGALRAGWAFAARHRFVILYVVAAWLLPLAIGEEGGGLHRREAALLPLVLLTAHLPAPLQAVLAGAAAVVAYAVALLFFRGQLV